MSGFSWPYRIDGRGRTAGPTTGEHVRQLIEQLLFTAPGERVMRPDLGSGLLHLVFSPNSVELAAAVQFRLQGTLQQVLADAARIEDLAVEVDDATLSIRVSFIPRHSNEREVVVFTREV